MVRRQSSATWLLLAYAALIVYASLYPFGPWFWPPGLTLEGMLRLPWPRYFGLFDQYINLLGYLPLGFLGLAAGLRSGWGLWGSIALGLLPGPLLSYAMEFGQYFLPSRVPSLADWLLNSVGALVGMLACLLLNAFGGLRRWHDVREYWFQPHCAGALALLALWPLGLLFPAPIPLALGQWLPHLQTTAQDLLAGTPWALQWSENLVDETRALPPGLEAITIALGVLAPALLVLAVSRWALAAGGLGLRCGLDWRHGHGAFHRAEFWAAKHLGLVDLGHLARLGGRRAAQLGGGVAAEAGVRGAGSGGDVCLDRSGQPGTVGPVSRAAPADLGAESLCQSLWFGGMGGLDLALCRRRLAADPDRAARRLDWVSPRPPRGLGAPVPTIAA